MHSTTLWQSLLYFFISREIPAAVGTQEMLGRYVLTCPWRGLFSLILCGGAIADWGGRKGVTNHRISQEFESF